MRTAYFLLFFGTFALASVSAHAQIVNGDFSGGSTGWTAVTTSAPTYSIDASAPSGYEVELDSLDAGGHTNPPPSGASTATDIESALGITSLPSGDFSFAPSDGQAIYQTFTLTATVDLSFSTAFSTNDTAPYDSVGYTINGAYTQLAAPGSNTSDPNSFGTTTIELGPGTYQLGFVAFNTDDNDDSTSLYVSNIAIAELPEPGAWALMAGGLVLLFAAGRFGRQAFRA